MGSPKVWLAELLRTINRRIEGLFNYSTLGKRIVHGSFWSLTGAFASRGLAFLSIIAASRILGSADYGQLAVVQNTVGMLGTIVGLSLGLTANKHIAEFKKRDAKRASQILSLCTIVTVISSAILSLLLYLTSELIAVSLFGQPELEPLLTLGCLILFLSAINAFQFGALAGLEAFKYIAHINLIYGCVNMLLVLVGAFYFGVEGVLYAMVVANAISCLLAWRLIERTAKQHNMPRQYSGIWSENKFLWSFSTPAILAEISNNVVMWWAAALVVSSASAFTDYGVFSAVYRVKLLPEALLAMLLAPTLPILAESIKESEVIFNKTLSYVYGLALLIIVPLALLVTVFPWMVLQLFGAEYADGTEIVQYLFMHSVIFAAFYPFGMILMASGMMWANYVVQLINAIALAVFCYFLIPSHGAMGFAISLVLACLCSRFIALLFLTWRFPKTIKHLKLLQSIIIVLVVYMATSFIKNLDETIVVVPVLVIGTALVMLLAKQLISPSNGSN